MNLSSHNYAVVLAGGSGTRFWPKSRQKRPKQLCDLGGGGKTLIEETLSRLDELFAPNKRLIVTHQLQAHATSLLVSSQVSMVMAEPTAKNTAAALILAALEIKARGGPGAIMSSFHADHHIKDKLAFSKAIRAAQESAASGRLALVGIKPRHPETGFGYIEKGNARGNTDFDVASFREKPDLETAKSFLASGNFLWNSGMFHWQVETFLSECRRLALDSLEPLELLFHKYLNFDQIPADHLARVYQELPNVAVDNAILEKSDKISVVEGDFEWHDVGSWSALAESYPEKNDQELNFKSGDVLLIDCKNVTAESDGPLLVGLGLEDFIVVHCEGAILVCPKNRAQDVKLIVDELKRKGREKFI